MGLEWSYVTALARPSFALYTGNCYSQQENRLMIRELQAYRFDGNVSSFFLR